MLRDWVRRAGSVAGIGNDVFFLRIGEILSLLKGDRDMLGLIGPRRAAYDHYRSLPSYPGVIRGRFDPERWAADPDRRTDYAGAKAGMPERNGSITGFPGAAGVVEGIARLIPSVGESEHLAAGEILVTSVTNVGWTPLFPAPPRWSPTSGRRCRTPRSWHVNWASPPSWARATRPRGSATGPACGWTARRGRWRSSTDRARPPLAPHG